MKGAVVDSGRLHPNGRGVEPSRARRDTRYKQTYIFGGARGTTTGLILLYVNAEAVGLWGCILMRSQKQSHPAHMRCSSQTGQAAQSKLLASARSNYARYTAAVFTITKPD
jgi:hypothetical protein